MPTVELRNPKNKDGQPFVRYAKARVDIDYIDGSGTKQSLHYEMDLEPPMGDHPDYQIGIREL